MTVTWSATKHRLKQTPLVLARQILRNGKLRTRLGTTLFRIPPWPFRQYLASHRLKMVYAQIPKVASGNIKRWMLEQEGYPEERWELHTAYGIHPFADNTLRMRNMRLLEDPSYLKVVFVRDPFARLVSGFLDKFVLPLTQTPEQRRASPAWAVLAWIKARRRYDHPEQVTFEDFVDFVASAPDIALDLHWLPQHRFIDSVKFDFIGKLERFDQDLVLLAQRLQSPIELRTRKPPLPYEKTIRSYAGNLSIAELAARQQYPHATSFYQKATMRRVAARYRDDFRLFDYSPELEVVG